MGSFQRTQTEESTAAIAGTLSTETIFETLSNRRRRYVLHCLRQTGDAMTIRALSEQLAAWENGCERSEVRPKERKRLYTALHQTHLPKMDQLGVVEYDKDRGVVTLTEAISEFDTYLDEKGDGHLSWSHVYLTLGGVLTALVAAAGLGVSPFTTVDGTVYAAAAAVGVTVTAGCHAFVDWNRRRTPGRSPTDVLVPPVETMEPTGESASGRPSDDER